MTQPSKERVLALLRSGTAQERVAFVDSLPPNGFKDAAVALMGSESPGIIVVALGSVIHEYCYGRNPEYGAILAAAAHERAVEIWQTVPNHGLIPTTLSALACGHVNALTLLGRSEEAFDATTKYIEFYERLEEHQNLPTLKVLRIESLVNLKRLDQAAAELQDDALLRHPIAGIEAKRLKGWVDRYRADPATLKSEQKAAPTPLSSQEMLDIMKTAIGIGFEGEAATELQHQVDQLDLSNRLNPDDPQQFNELLKVLEQGEEILLRGADGSQLSVRRKIRNASSIFVHGTPTPDEIQRSLVDLESGLGWTRRHGVADLENDALWGIYLCNSRLKKPSQAADSLIQLRRNLESIRQGIKDPLKRGDVFGTYRYLFNALCEQLHKARRVDDLLMAIESSKGRVIADRLTAQTEHVVEDSAIYGCVARLPELVSRERFHYLTYFVDEDCVYAAFVSKKGTIYAIDPIPVRNHDLRDAAVNVAPDQWGRPKFSDQTTAMNVSTDLSPLVAWLDTLLEQGVVEKDDHICYSSDDDFNNIPLQYLRFRDGILIDWFSVSRVHSAFHLDRVLSRKADGKFERFAGFAVPLRQDLDKQNRDAFLANLDAPLKWLKDYGLNGKPVRLSEATLERVTKESLNHRIVHFSTHGWFPRQSGNPFHDSFLLLADKDGLPDKERVNRGDHKGKLTPSGILNAGLDFEGSHISMMACVSGLVKEGIAGDSLGLEWAFIQAGASSLISTHWNIRAACAAHFFTRFYQKWIGHKHSRASAFRETMLQLLNRNYTPKSLQQWSGFSLTGDFR